MYDELVEALRLCVRYGKGADVLANALKAADAIEELSKPRWIPVTERLPDVGKEVLVCDSQRNVTKAWVVEHITAGTRTLEWGCSDGWIDDQLPITHWQKLPEPPKEDTT